MTAEREAMTERKAFEAWIASDSDMHPRALERLGDGYEKPNTQGRWLGWQAAIDAHLSRAAEPVAWVPVCGYEEYYEVSSAGDIRSLNSGRILSKPIMGAGYQKASLWKDGERAQTSVHRIVATAFHGPAPSPSHEVNHKNGIKTDNRAANLEWVTRSENEKHSRDVLGNLCQPIVATSIDTGEEFSFLSMAEAAKALNISHKQMWNCLTGRKKSRKGFTFRRIESHTHPPEPVRDALSRLLVPGLRVYTGDYVVQIDAGKLGLFTERFTDEKDKPRAIRVVQQRAIDAAMAQESGE